MKTKIILMLIVVTMIGTISYAQKTEPGEKYGNTLNLGLGLGYYGYVGHSLPVLHLDYELDVARNFTLAPFINYYSYSENYNYKNNWYYYHQTIIPIGLKGTYYFDDLLKASSKWDFYLAGSLGFVIVNSYWDDGYTGDRNVFNNPNSLYLDLHIGTEYHFNNRVGMFLDLSTGVSTVGLAFHGSK